MDTPPEPPSTYWLPHLEKDKRGEIIDAVDKSLTDMNDEITGVDPTEYKMWDVTGGNEVPGLTRMLPVTDHINAVADQLNTFSDNMSNLLSGSESNLLGSYAEAIKPSMDVIAGFNADAGKPLSDSVIDASTTANEAYQLLLDANQKSRETLAKSKGNILHVIPHSSVDKDDLVTNSEAIKRKLEELREQQRGIRDSVKDLSLIHI